MRTKPTVWFVIRVFYPLFTSVNDLVAVDLCHEITELAFEELLDLQSLGFRYFMRESARSSGELYMLQRLFIIDDRLSDNRKNKIFDALLVHRFYDYVSFSS